jgi:flagellum-specific ATP synthase
MTSRMMKSAAAALPQLDFAPRRVGQLTAHDGLMLEARGCTQPLGSTVRIVMPTGATSVGEIVGFRGDRTLILPFGRGIPYASGSRVEPAGHANQVACGKALLGRIIDGLGQPLDGRGPILSRSSWPLAGRKTNPLHRARVTKPFDLGVRAVNGLLSAGEGQRIAIIAGSGVGKSVLMGQMLAGAVCDIVVIGLVGERSREVSDFVETKLPATMRHRSVVVAVPADDPPLLRLRAAMRATAIAEHFRQAGKRVLLMIDSLTRVAHAQREIGLALGEPPTMKGYPPSALGLIPSLVERAGADRSTGGSITAIYTVLADGGDTEDPIVDAARAIVDGHIVLSRNLAEQGIYPAIDIAKSLSRIMPDVADPAHVQAAAKFRQLWCAYEDNRDLLMMGAYVPGHDSAFDEAIARRGEMLDFIAQSQADRHDLTTSRTALIEGFGHD